MRGRADALSGSIRSSTAQSIRPEHPLPGLRTCAVIPSEPLAFQPPHSPRLPSPRPQAGWPQGSGHSRRGHRTEAQGLRPCASTQDSGDRGQQGSPHTQVDEAPARDGVGFCLPRGGECPPAHPTPGSPTSHKPQDDPEGGERKAAPGPWPQGPLAVQCLGFLFPRPQPETPVCTDPEA